MKIKVRLFFVVSWAAFLFENLWRPYHNVGISYKFFSPRGEHINSPLFSIHMCKYTHTQIQKKVSECKWARLNLNSYLSEWKKACFRDWYIFHFSTWVCLNVVFGYCLLKMLMLGMLIYIFWFSCGQYILHNEVVNTETHCVQITSASLLAWEMEIQHITLNACFYLFMQLLSKDFISGWKALV